MSFYDVIAEGFLEKKIPYSGCGIGYVQDEPVITSCHTDIARTLLRIVRVKSGRIRQI